MGRWKGSHYKSEDFERIAFRCEGVNVAPGYYCHQFYNLEIYEENEITPTGLLIIAKLEPQKSSLPSFWFRWDEKMDTLDVDIQGIALAVKECFERGEKGYRGHRTKRKDSERRTFEVDIGIPEIHVFHGCLSFNLYRKAAVGKGTVNSVGTTSPEPI